MNAVKTDLTNDLKVFISKEKQSNKVIEAIILEINDNMLKVSTKYNNDLSKNTPIEIDRTPSKVIKKNGKILIITPLVKSDFLTNQKVSIKNIQKEIIINKLQEILDSIENNQLNKENMDTLNVLTNKHKVSFNDNDYKISSKLNVNQKIAVKKVLQSEKFHIIQGPPGSGKTHTIIEIIKHLYSSDKKVLLTTHTHVALDNIIERLDSFNSRDILRLGPNEKISDNILKYSLNEQIKKHPDYHKILEKMKMIEKLEKRGDDFENVLSVTSTKMSFLNRLFNRIFNNNENENMVNNYGVVPSKDHNIERINEIKSEISQIRNNIQYDIVNNAKIIASTVLSSSSFLTKDIEFDYVIMDEASQVPVYMALIPLLKTDMFILIGDNKQLQPIQNKNASYLLNKSIFNLLIEKYPENYTFLNIQYRMNEKISNIASELYYDDKLLTGDIAKKQMITLVNNKYFLLNEDVITVMDTSSVGFDESYVSNGCLNVFEANLIVDIVRALVNNDVCEDEIGIITPYRKQKNHINNLLKKMGSVVECDTIYRFQGREKDVIIISLCKSSDKSLGFFQRKFLDDENQLNVSITRSRKKLIIIGNFSMLSDAENIRKLFDKVEPDSVLYFADFL